MTLFLAATAMLNLQLTQNQCISKTVLKNSSGKTYEIVKPSSSLGASWVYRNTIYVLQSYKVEKNEPASVPLVVQSSSIPLESKVARRTQEHIVTYSLNVGQHIEQSAVDRVTESENVSPEKKQIYEIVANGQRNFLSTQIERTDGDVVKRQTVLNANPKTEKDGFRMISSEQECSTSIVDEKAIQSDALLKKAVDTFSTYLKSTKTAEAALQSCLSQGKSDCAQENSALKLKVAGITSVWNGLISAGQLQQIARK